MLCDDFRDQFLGGDPLKGPLEEHLAACPGCRDEFAFVGVLQSAPPLPSDALRDRVLASFPRPIRRPVAAWAASLILAAGLGFAVGAMKKPVERVVEKPVVADFTDDHILVLVQCLQQHYRDNVGFDFEGGTCRHIHIDPGLLDIDCCSTMREARLLAKERPGFIVMK